MSKMRLRAKPKQKVTAKAKAKARCVHVESDDEPISPSDGSTGSSPILTGPYS
jgi:hypothetical protein